MSTAPGSSPAPAPPPPPPQTEPPFAPARASSFASRRAIFAWCLFDFANSAFNTVIVTFLYAQLFAERLVGDQQRGDVLWARTLTISGLVVAVASPFLGAAADRAAHKRRYVVLFSLLTIACTAFLFFQTPDAGAGNAGASEATILRVLIAVTVANVAFELAFVFYNAFLPHLGDEATVGRLSGYAWGFGYVGGLLCLAVCWLVVEHAPAENLLNQRLTTLVVAAWFLVFGLPMFLWVRDRPLAPGSARAPFSFRAILREVAATVQSLRGCPDLVRLLVGHLIYNDALMALIGLAGLYMGHTLGMPFGQIALMGIGLNVAAGIGAVAFGFIDDFLGAKTAIVSSLLLLIAGSLLALLVPTVPAFVVAGSIIGIGMGPAQSASRTLLARFVPAARSAEYYGLYALSGKATVWVGTTLFWIVRSATGDQRLALSPLVVMFVLGLLVVLGIDERRGRARASELAARPVAAPSGAPLR